MIHFTDQQRRTIAGARTVASLSRLHTEKIECVEVNQGQYLVADRFTFYPVSGLWLGEGKKGGDVSSLIAAVRALP